MKVKSLIALFIFFILSSCSDKKEENKLKTIYLKETNDILPISSFVEDVDYIELSFENNNSVIGEIEDFKILDNDIVIKQRIARETSLLRFSKEGKFLNEIGVNGKGANEILYPRDIINYNDGYAVWDQLAVHSISKTGKYKHKLFDAHVQGNRFFYLQNSFYLFHELAAPGYLSKYTPEGDLEHVFRPNNFEFGSLGYSEILSTKQNSYNLFTPMIDTVFTFSNDELTPEYILEGEDTPTFMQILKKAGNRNPLDLLQFINENKHVVVEKYLENDNYIFMSYRIKADVFNLFIKKKTWDFTSFKKCINDLDGGLWRKPYHLSKDDILYIPIYPFEIKNHKIANKYNKDFKILQDKIIPNDNPVIMRCKLK